MKLKKKFLLPVVALMVGQLLTGCNSAQKQNVALKSEDDKVLYTMGVMFGGRLKDLKLTQGEMDFLMKGMSDSALGVKPEVDINEYQAKVQQFFGDRMKKNADGIKKDGTSYIEKFLKDEKGAQKTASGLAYTVIKEGTGLKPAETDTVEVHYHGTLIDGTVFDSSRERGKTAVFPLNRVIRGWTEGMQLIKEGGQVKLAIPSDLAYGDHGAPPKIPGGATLIFDVELIKIVKDADKLEEGAAAVGGAASAEHAATSGGEGAQPAAKKGQAHKKAEGAHHKKK